MRNAGSVVLSCDADRGRSRLRAIRCEGLSRSSRALPQRSGAIRLVLSTLGPGVLAGDAFTLRGAVHECAALFASGQMATPVFAGTLPSQTASVWNVAAGATLFVAGEPLLLEAGSVLRAEANYAIAGSGRAIVIDTFALRGAARLTMRTSATMDGRLVYRDALDVAEPGTAFGTVALIAAAPAQRAALLGVAYAIAAAYPVRAGSGETPGAAIVRLHGNRVWDVRAAALAIAEAVLTAPDAADRLSAP